TACGPASQVAQGVLDAEAVRVARGLRQEGLGLPARLGGAVRLLVGQAEVVVGVRKVAAALSYGLAEGRLRAAVGLLLRERGAEGASGMAAGPGRLWAVGELGCNSTARRRSRRAAW